MIVSLKLRNVSDKSCNENDNTNFLLNIMFPKIVAFVTQCENHGTVK
jgi:hypothetical protein